MPSTWDLGPEVIFSPMSCHSVLLVTFLNSWLQSSFHYSYVGTLCCFGQWGYLLRTKHCLTQSMLNECVNEGVLNPNSKGAVEAQCYSICSEHLWGHIEVCIDPSWATIAKMWSKQTAVRFAPSFYEHTFKRVKQASLCYAAVSLAQCTRSHVFLYTNVGQKREWTLEYGIPSVLWIYNTSLLFMELLTWAAPFASLIACSRSGDHVNSTLKYISFLTPLYRSVKLRTGEAKGLSRSYDGNMGCQAHPPTGSPARFHVCLSVCTVQPFVRLQASS